MNELERYAPQFDLCLYNAGMDPYEHCQMGGLSDITREILATRERMVFEWCQQRGPVDLHRQPISVAVHLGPFTYAD